MKNALAVGANFVWKVACGIVILPFIAVAFGITKLLGGEPLSMDDMGAGFMIMCAIAIGLGIATVAFGIGYLI
jgi:hypothetical protein